MDLLPAGGEMIVKKHRFRSLKMVDLNYDDVLSDVPYGAEYGKLDNGLTYYVRLNSKPKMRAALALAVKVGEENVYLLCKKLSEDGVADVSDLFVVFITNESKHVRV